MNEHIALHRIAQAIHPGIWVPFTEDRAKAFNMTLEKHLLLQAYSLRCARAAVEAMRTAGPWYISWDVSCPPTPAEVWKTGIDAILKETPHVDKIHGDSNA